MKKCITYFIIATISVVVFMGVEMNALTVFAWGDSDGGRPEYTIADINSGALGPVGEGAANQPGYPGTIVFNSISDGPIGHEYAFVGAREDTGINQGAENIWNSSTITAEDGKTYLIRLYVHNNNANGMDAIAEDVRVSFSIPAAPSQSIRVHGFLYSSNTTPSEYWDHVDFESKIPFHLEYIYGSALLENGGIGAGGLQLSDEIVTKSGGTLIGYEALDGRIPGCYRYVSYITIRVKVVYDYGFNVKNRVRIVDREDSVWNTMVDAQLDDILEFQIIYQNNDTITHSNVILFDILPPGLEYIVGSTALYDMSEQRIDGTPINDIITAEGRGVNIGSYEPGTYAQVRFRAKVIGNGLDDGRNTLVNGAKVQVDHVTMQDHVLVEVYSIEKLKTIVTGIIVLFMAIALYKILFKEYIREKKS